MSALENLLSPRAKLVVKRAVEIKTGTGELSKTHILALTEGLERDESFAAKFEDYSTRKSISPNMINSIAATLNLFVDGNSLSE